MKHIEIMRNQKSIVGIALAMMALTLTHCGSSGSNHANVPGAPPATPVSASGVPNSVQLAPTAAVSGDVLKITSINGTYAASHAANVYVHPGDVVFLSADIFVAAKNMAAAGANVESFVWSSSLNDQDICDASKGLDCLKASNFEISDYGVAFYAPYTMPENVQITVRTNLANETDASGHSIFDVITLHNMAFNGQPVAVPSIITDPANYVSTGATLSPDTALAGLGHWVTVDNVRYFSPISYTVPEETEWVPYRHGYWTWADQAEHGGWTWVSNDPWGWVTDHYGVWRHHANYGWLWLPFEDVHYEPAVVTFMDEGNHVAWVPFRESFNNLYVHGAVEGFDDGYWGGFHGISEHFGEPRYLFHPGFAIVLRTDMNRENLIDVIINRGPHFDNHLSIVISGAFSSHHFCADHFEDHGFGRPLAVTSLLSFNLHGGGVFFAPRFLHPMPAESIGFVASLHPGRPFGLGIVASFGVGGGTPRFLPPSSNGRVFEAPPLIRDAGGIPVGRLPMHTEHPAMVNRENPIGSFRPTPQFSALPTNHVPEFNPRQKPAPDVVPVGAPRGPAPQGSNRPNNPVPQGGRPNGPGPEAPAPSQPQAPAHQPAAPQSPAPQAPGAVHNNSPQPAPGAPHPVEPARRPTPTAPGSQPQQPGHTPASPSATPHSGTPAAAPTPAPGQVSRTGSPSPTAPATSPATRSTAPLSRDAAPTTQSPAPATRTAPAPSTSTPLTRTAPQPQRQPTQPQRQQTQPAASTPRPQTTALTSGSSDLSARPQPSRPRGMQNRPAPNATSSNDDTNSVRSSDRSTGINSGTQDSSARSSGGRCSSGQGDCSTDSGSGGRPRH